MKRIIIALMSLALTAPALAQHGRPHYYNRTTNNSRHYDHQMYYGLRLGVAFSTVNSDDQYLNGSSAKSGLDIGAVVGLQLGYRSPIFFETGLSYIEKGGDGRYQGDKFSYSLNYLEVPMVLKYKYDVDRSFSIQPFLGGFMSVGVGGKIKDFGMRQAFSSFDDDAFKRFDGGIRVGCGIQYDFLYAEMGYDFGLANISHDYFDTSHTGTLFTTIGVNF